MKNKIVKTFVSSVAFGICYGLITLIFDHEIDWRQIAITTIFYFAFVNIWNYIGTKIKNKKW